MLLSKAIGGEPTEPKHFWDIFEVNPEDTSFHIPINVPYSEVSIPM